MTEPFAIETLDPRLLTAHPSNFRRHPEAQRTALGESIAEHGWLSAPIWNRRTGHVLDGHARVELAVSTGEALIPVRVLDVSERQERRILASFDRIGELRERDDAALAALLADLSEDGGLPAGWSDDDLNALLADVSGTGGGLLPGVDPDAIPEAIETRCQPGDLWQLGAHRLLCGDSTKAEDVARLMGGEKADVCITSPPYNLGDDHHTDRKRTQSYPDSQPESVYQEQQRRFLQSLAEVIAGDCFYQHKNRIKDGLWISPSAWVEVSPWRIAQELVWINGGPNMDCRRFYPQTERIYWLTRWGSTTRLENIEHLTDWWQLAPVGSDGEHKQCFPVELPRRLLVAAHASCIYDPFAGSGTTLIACEVTGRAARCLEISPQFCDVILARYAAATGKEPELLEH